MLKNHILIIVLLVSVLLLVLAATTYVLSKRWSEENAAIGTLLEVAKTDVLLDSSGAPVSFEQYESTVRVINSWASWTPFSSTELPLLNELASQYKDSGVVFLAINRDEPVERIDAFLATLPPLQNITFIRDVEDSLYAASLGYTMPETLFYDADGNLIFHKRGALTREEAIEYIEAALTADD